MCSHFVLTAVTAVTVVTVFLLFVVGCWLPAWAQVFDPATGAWAKLASMPSPRAQARKAKQSAGVVVLSFGGM